MRKLNFEMLSDYQYQHSPCNIDVSEVIEFELIFKYPSTTVKAQTSGMLAKLENVGCLH